MTEDNGKRNILLSNLFLKCEKNKFSFYCCTTSLKSQIFKLLNFLFSNQLQIKQGNSLFCLNDENTKTFFLLQSCWRDCNLYSSQLEDSLSKIKISILNQLNSVR